MVELEVLGLVGIFVAVGIFFLGIIVGKSSDKKMIDNVKQAIVKAHNIDRILDGRDQEKQNLFIDEGEIKGSKEVSFSFELKADIIDFIKKKKYTNKGTVDLTDADIIELRKLPQFRKTPI